MLEKRREREEVDPRTRAGGEDFSYASVGQHIRNHRLRHCDKRTGRLWSQEDLAIAIGTDKTHINRIECGRQLPTRETVSRICDALELAWAARRRLMGLFGYLNELPKPKPEDMAKIAAVVRHGMEVSSHPVCLLDQGDRIWDINRAFASLVLGYGNARACLDDIRGRTLLELLCDTHPAHVYLRRNLVNFDQLALRLLGGLRRALESPAASIRYQNLINDVLADPRLCALWLRIIANIDHDEMPEYLDHQVLEFRRSPIGPFSALLWHASLQADERFRMLHVMPKSDDERHRFERFHARRSGKATHAERSGSAKRASSAGQFPFKPITLYVPWANGGITDIGARILAPFIEEALECPVSVINCDTVQSQAAIRELSGLPADGHHLVFINTPVSTAVPTVSDRPRPLRVNKALSAFEHVICHAYDVFGIYVRTDSTYRTLKDFIRDASNHPGTIIAGTSGAGTAAHIAARLIEQTAGISLCCEHFSGSMEHMARFLSGQTDVACLGAGMSVPAVRAGELRLLAVLAGERLEELEDVPTARESGLDTTGIASMRDIYLPGGCDPQIVATLKACLGRTMKDTRHLDRMRMAGLQTYDSEGSHE